MTDSVRLDRWLWAARFYKTRSLARQAVEGGRVHLNQTRVKPARAVKVGDRLEITRNQEQFVVDVLAVAERRGPAPEARQLYAETEASRRARETAAEQRRLERLSAPHSDRRPGKRDRRLIRRFKERD